MIIFDFAVSLYDWVDLNLPSHLLWSTHNVGAAEISDLGDYFAWSEINVRTPTIEEWRELIENTTPEWARIGRVNGLCLTGRNGNRLFLPAAGNLYKSSLCGVNDTGLYWTSSLFGDDKATCFRFDALGSSFSLGFVRSDCLSVRAVKTA